MSEFKNCYKYSDVCARIISGGNLDTIDEMGVAEIIYGGPKNFIIHKVYYFGENGTWIANSCLVDDSSHYCFSKEAQKWLTANEDWWTGKWGKKEREAEKENASNFHKTAHTNYSIDHVIECLKKSPLYTAETVSYLYRLKDEGYSLVCWSTVNGWVTINYDVAKDNSHADIKHFSYHDASVLEECYNKGEFD